VEKLGGMVMRKEHRKIKAPIVGKEAKKYSSEEIEKHEIIYGENFFEEISPSQCF
jgi:hypothetical protein